MKQKGLWAKCSTSRLGRLRNHNLEYHVRWYRPWDQFGERLVERGKKLIRSFQFNGDSMLCRSLHDIMPIIDFIRIDYTSVIWSLIRIEFNNCIYAPSLGASWCLVEQSNPRACFLWGEMLFLFSSLNFLLHWIYAVRFPVIRMNSLLCQVNTLVWGNCCFRNFFLIST